ncbi:MAG: hypothetical protein FDW93_00755 [Bergeyella sp.]|nr:hypothetical protein [Bergeyella sp.]
MNTNKARSLDYFLRHPLSNECHIVEGRIFYTKDTAQSFSNTLEHAEVESFYRSNLKENEGEEKKTVRKNPEGKAKEEVKKRPFQAAQQNKKEKTQPQEKTATP